MTVRHVTFRTGLAVGAPGAATATGRTNHAIVGRVTALFVEYQGSPPAGTTDVIVRTAGASGPVLTILTRTNTITGGWFYPRLVEHDEVGTPLATRRAPATADQLEVTILQTDANAEALITAIYSDA
jgi:hypothetical protein